MIGEMWTSMAITGKAIIALLGLLSVYSMAVVVERFVALRWATRSSRAFVSEAAGITDASAMRDRATAPEYADFASLAHVVGNGLDEFDRIRTEEDDGDLILECRECRGFWCRPAREAHEQQPRACQRSDHQGGVRDVSVPH